MNLSDIVAVAVVIIFSVHHRISGILALLVVIACMPYNNTHVVEGIDNSMQTPDSETPERIKKRVCANTSANAYEYMLSPALLDSDPSCDEATKEGFTPTIKVSPVQNIKNVVKDNVRKAKTMTESFFSR